MSRSVRVIAGCVIVAALVVGAVWVGVWLTGRKTADVPMPPHDARPDQVVRAYLKALDAHDCATAVALRSARGDSRQLGRLWCRDVHDLTLLEVEPADRSGGELDVNTSFDFSWRPFHDDGSLDPGRIGWTYVMVRDEPGGPWRIADEGQG